MAMGGYPCDHWTTYTLFSRRSVGLVLRQTNLNTCMDIKACRHTHTHAQTHRHTYSMNIIVMGGQGQYCPTRDS